MNSKPVNPRSALWLILLVVGALIFLFAMAMTPPSTAKKIVGAGVLIAFTLGLVLWVLRQDRV